MAFTSPPTLKLAGPGEQHCIDRLAVGKVVPNGPEFMNEPLIDRVAGVGAVEGDDGDLVGDLDADMLIGGVALHACLQENGV